MPYADSPAEVVFKLHYTESNRLFTWTESTLRIQPSNAPPTVGDGSGHGAYFWEQSTGSLTVKVKGGRRVELRTESVIQINAKLAIDVNAFFDTQASADRLLLLDTCCLLQWNMVNNGHLPAGK